MIGNVFTMEEHRKKGLASTLISRFTAALLRTGYVPHCDIVVGNTASEKLFTHNGYVAMESTNWVGSYIPL